MKKVLQYFWSLNGVTQTDELTAFTFAFNQDQRTDENISLTATPSGNYNVTEYRWEIRNTSDNLLAGLSFDRVASVPIDTVGFYDLVFTAKSATDQYIVKWRRAFFVWYPKFTEGEADVVVNLASGNYYQDFAEADSSGLKIYVKGSGTAYFQVVGLFGTAGWANKVRIQKEIGNTTIDQSCPNGSPHALYIYGNNQHIVFDGWNTDHTQGWNLTGHPTGSAQIISCSGGQYSDIHFMGMSTEHVTNVNAGAWSFIPPTDATTNASTWVCDNMTVYANNINESGEEGVYMGYNSDTLIGGYRPPKFRNAIIAWNTILNCGRDGIQPGGCVNIEVHNNYISGTGKQSDVSHESGISWNSGNYGKCFANYIINSNMLLNIQSGYAPWDIEGGQTTPQKSQFFSNVYISGTYPGAAEPFAIYCQNQSTGGDTANWPVEIYNNTLKTDKKIMEAYFFTGSFTWTGHKNVNNIYVGTTSGGDYPELNLTGPGTQPTGTTINNIFKTVAAQSDIGFTDYAGNDLTIASLSSIVYTGATDVSSYDGDYGYDGQPLNADGFAYGAYSGYSKKTITPTVGDADPATFSTPLAIGTLTQSGGTITFEANKTGILYWAIVANNATAPTEAQLRAGGFGVASGAILDSGTAGSYVVSTLTEGTAYDLHGIFVTVDNVPQASVTKVDFTTSADVVAPTVSSMTISDANRDKIVIVFTEAVTGTNAGFTIAGTTSTSFSSISGTGTNTITGTMAVAATYGQTITLAYSSTTGDLRDLATTPNDLATFGATSITNNIAPAAQEAVTWVDGTNVTITTNSFVTTSTSNTARSSQIIPAASNGYIKFTWATTNQRTSSASDWKGGFIASADARTAANIDMTCDFNTNTNTDVYEGTTYKSTISGGTAIQTAGLLHRWRIDRGTQKIYYETSSDDTNWTLRATLSGTVTGDLRFGFFGNKTGKTIDNAYIQADYGLT